MAKDRLGRRAAQDHDQAAERRGHTAHHTERDSRPHMLLRVLIVGSHALHVRRDKGHEQRQADAHRSGAHLQAGSATMRSLGNARGLSSLCGNGPARPEGCRWGKTRTSAAGSDPRPAGTR